VERAVVRLNELTASLHATCIMPPGYSMESNSRRTSLSLTICACDREHVGPSGLVLFRGHWIPHEIGEVCIQIAHLRSVRPGQVQRALPHSS